MREVNRICKDRDFSHPRHKSVIVVCWGGLREYAVLQKLILIHYLVAQWLLERKDVHFFSDITKSGPPSNPLSTKKLAMAGCTLVGGPRFRSQPCLVMYTVYKAKSQPRHSPLLRRQTLWYRRGCEWYAMVRQMRVTLIQTIHAISIAHLVTQRPK